MGGEVVFVDECRRGLVGVCHALLQGIGVTGCGAGSTPRPEATRGHICRQRKTSPLVVLKAWLRAAGSVADQTAWRLRAENAELRVRLERLVSRNSGNSSMPPSTDDLPGRTPPAGQPRAGAGGKRKRGKQPGAPG